MIWNVHMKYIKNEKWNMKNVYINIYMKIYDFMTNIYGKVTYIS